MRTVKLILGTFCLACFLGTAVAQEESVKFFGNVKSVKETTYKATEKFGEAIKGKVLNTAVWKYDDKGRLIEKPDCFYKYDGNGNVIEEIKYGNKTTWSYNEKGRKIETNIYGIDGKLYQKIKCKYNDLGKLIDSSCYQYNYVDEKKRHIYEEKLTNRTIWKYDNHGNLADKSSYNGEGNLIDREKFDSQGNHTDVSGYNDEGILIYRKKFDNYGNCIDIDASRLTDFYRREIKVYDKDRFLEHSLYALIERYPHIFGFGNNTDEITHEIILVWRCIHKFDEKGNIVQELLLGQGKDTLSIRTHTYDIHGNLIKTFADNGSWCGRWGNGSTSFREITNKYNEKETLIEESDYCMDYINYWEPYGGSAHGGYTNIYNDDGVILSRENWGMRMGMGRDYSEYDYDEKGNVIEILTKWGEKPYGEEYDDEYKTEYSYTYDRHDNWTKRVKYETKGNTLPICTEIVEREIEYWE